MSDIPVSINFIANAQSLVAASNTAKTAITAVGTAAREASVSYGGLATATREQAAATDVVVASSRRATEEHKRHAREMGELEKSARGAAGAFTGLSKAMMFGSNAFISGAILGGAAKTIMDAFEAAQKAQSMLKNAVENAGVSWAENQKQINANLDALSRQSAFIKGDLAGSLVTLITLTHNVGTSQKDLALATELARQRNLDLSTAVRDVVLVQEGHSAILRRQGIDLPQVTTAVDQLKQKLAELKAAHMQVSLASEQQAMKLAKAQDAAATASVDMQKLTASVKGADSAFLKTSAGTMAQFHNSMNQLEIDLGQVLVPDIDRLVERLTRWLDNGRNVTTMQRDLKTGLDAVAAAFKAVKTVVDGVDQVTGSFKHTLELLIALKFASVIAGWTKELKAFVAEGKIASSLGGAGGLAGAALGVAGGVLAYEFTSNVDTTSKPIPVSGGRIYKAGGKWYFQRTSANRGATKPEQISASQAAAMAGVQLPGSTSEGNSSPQRSGSAPDRTQYPAGATLTKAQIAALWVKAGGAPGMAWIMADIAVRGESGGYTLAKNFNKNGTIDRGIFQINSSHGYGLASFDPLQNAREAVSIFNSQGLAAWTDPVAAAYLAQLGNHPSGGGGGGTNPADLLQFTPKPTRPKKITPASTASIRSAIDRAKSELAQIDKLGAKLGDFPTLQKALDPAMKKWKAQLADFQKQLESKGLITPKTVANLNVSMAEIEKAIKGGLTRAQAAVTERKAAFQTAWGNLAQAALDAFDAETGNYKAPDLEKLAKMQAEDIVTADQKAVDDARKALTTAQQGAPDTSSALQAVRQLLGQANLAVGIGNAQAGILGGSGFDQGLIGLIGQLTQAAQPRNIVDPQAVLNAQDTLNQALRKQQEDQLQVTGDAQQKAWDDQRASERKTLDESMKAWESYYEKLGTKASAALADLQQQLTNFYRGLGVPVPDWISGLSGGTPGVGPGTTDTSFGGTVARLPGPGRAVFAADGADFVASRPTLMVVGEGGSAEHVKVTPLRQVAGGASVTPVVEVHLHGGLDQIVQQVSVKQARAADRRARALRY